MDKKKASDEFEPDPNAPPPPRLVDRFGFVKQDQTNSPEGFKSRPANEHERYWLHNQIWSFVLLLLFIVSVQIN